MGEVIALADYAHLPPWARRAPGYWLKRAYYAMRKAGDALLRPYGVTVTQYQALGILHYKDGITQREMEEIIQIESASLSNLIDGLVRQGWVERQQHPADTRFKQVFLRPGGRELFARLPDVAAIVGKRMFAGLAEAEVERLRALLQICSENLQ